MDASVPSFGTQSARLDTIASYVPVCRSVADVGCDHAKLSIALARHKRAQKIFAMDLRPGPLRKATEAIHQAGLDAQITTILSDGLDKLTEDVDTIVIAGMGGDTIQHILSSEAGQKRCQNAQTFVLSPQSELWELRRFLREHAFYIQQEDMLVDKGKYYWIWVVVHGMGDESASWDQYPFGTYLSKAKNPIFYEFLQKELFQESALCEDLQNKIKQSGKTESLLESLQEHQSKKTYIETEISRWENSCQKNA